MTQNLNLYGSSDITLTQADSQVSSSGFTLKAQNTGTWCASNSSSCDDQSMSMYSNNASYGTYYNWYAATAGSGTYSTSSGNVSYSICPKGWRLPTGSSSGEWQALYNQYNSSAKMRGSPVNLVLSGTRSDGSTYNRGSYGYYWSSTARNSNYAYGLSLNSANVFPANDDGKYYGDTIRCVAQ